MAKPASDAAASLVFLLFLPDNPQRRPFFGNFSEPARGVAEPAWSRSPVVLDFL